MNKKIRTLIDSDDDYIVYLDDQFYVEYSWTDGYGDTPKGFGEIANEIGHLETVSLMYLAPDQMEPFRRMLGEAMARIIGDKDAAKAGESLETAESYLAERSQERARAWYLRASATALAVAVLIAVGLWLFREIAIARLGPNVFEVCLASLMGSVGSFMSIWIRSGRINVDAGAGKSIHQWEGCMRIVMGAACAFAVALGVKANILFSFTKSLDNPLAYLLVTCIAAGFSERLFLNLIGHIHDPALKNRRRRS